MWMSVHLLLFIARDVSITATYAKAVQQIISCKKKTAPLKRAACAETLRKPNVMLIMPNVMLIMPYVTQIQDVAYILRLSVR